MNYECMNVGALRATPNGDARRPRVISTPSTALGAGSAREGSLDFARDRLRGVEKSAPKRRQLGLDCGVSQQIPRLRSAPLGMTGQLGIMNNELENGLLPSASADGKERKPITWGFSPLSLGLKPHRGEPLVIRRLKPTAIRKIILNYDIWIF